MPMYTTLFTPTFFELRQLMLIQNQMNGSFYIEAQDLKKEHTTQISPLGISAYVRMRT